MPASGVWNSPVSFSSKGKDEQWPSPGAGSEQSLTLSASLSALLSPSLKSNHTLFQHYPHSFIHAVSSVSSHFLQHRLFSLIRSSLFLPSLLPQNLLLVSHPFLFASTLLVFLSANTKANTLNQGEGEHEAPHIFLGSQDPIWPYHCPNHQNVGDSSSITMSHSNHLSIIEIVFLPEGAWTKLGEWVNKGIIGLINSIFVRDDITTDFDLRYPMWDFCNTWNTTVKTMKMSVDSETALYHYNKLCSMSLSPGGGC